MTADKIADGFEVRAYEPGDEEGWLDCRVLSLRRTAYFDDVVTAKPQHGPGAIELVAVDEGTVIGVIDVTIDGDAATIDTIAVHPAHQRRGVATVLVRQAIDRLPPSIATLDAWTRDDGGTNAWYLAAGFVENFRYLHVYASDAEPDVSGIVATIYAGHPGLTMVKGFFHARIEAEDQLRAAYSRVHVCRQYLRSLAL